MIYSSMISAVINENNIENFGKMIRTICSPGCKVVKHVYGNRKTTEKSKSTFAKYDNMNFKDVEDFLVYSAEYSAMVPDGVWEYRSTRSCNSKYGTVVFQTFHYYGTVIFPQTITSIASSENLKSAETVDLTNNQPSQSPTDNDLTQLNDIAPNLVPFNQELEIPSSATSYVSILSKGDGNYKSVASGGETMEIHVSKKQRLGQELLPQSSLTEPCFQTYETCHNQISSIIQTSDVTAEGGGSHEISSSNASKGEFTTASATSSSTNTADMLNGIDGKRNCTIVSIAQEVQENAPALNNQSEMENITSSYETTTCTIFSKPFESQGTLAIYLNPYNHVYCLEFFYEFL
jgi:hypothetical protein